MKEWIITNGLGGFADSTDNGGMNTRRYHGLLVAPLNPPNNRMLILSKVDESIELNGKKINLYTNEANGESTDGYKYQVKFEKDVVPIFTYKIKDVIIEKTICMVREKNAVIVMYKISNGKNKLKINLTPIVNFRDFHSEYHERTFSFIQQADINKTQVKVNLSNCINIYASDSNYIEHKNDMFYGMHYRIEEERGFDCEENHYVPGTFEIGIKPNEDKKINFVCALDGEFGLDFKQMEELDGEKVIETEVKRINKLIKQSKLLEKYEENIINAKKSEINEEIYDDLVKKYIIASDSFIVYRNKNKLHSIIAGYPWFLDWGRDAFISFEGLLLISKRYDMAREVLLTFAHNIKEGLIPNGFSEYDGHPLYNSVDAPLLFIDAINKYIKYTRDYSFVQKKLYRYMKQIISNYVKGINLDENNIYLDLDDYLIASGSIHTQNTWMDAKVNNKAVTPRSGKAVEINAMWYNSLKIMEKLSEKFNEDVSVYTDLSEKCKKSFEEKFYNEKKKCLYDVIEVNGEIDKKDDKVRPNQLFAISMSYPILNCENEKAKKIFITVTKKLLNKYGLQTLAKNEEGYAPIYEGNPTQRDTIYHQGVTWPWLLGLYYDGMKNIIASCQDDNAKKELEKDLLLFRTTTAKTFISELNNGNTVGSISELYDSKNSKRGKGAFSQAWSVSEVFRIIFGK